MKNRILSRLICSGTAALLAAGCITGEGVDKDNLLIPVYGAALETEETGITIKQDTAWTEEEKFQGELSVEISGLFQWLHAQEEITASIPKPSEKTDEEAKEENSENSQEGQENVEEKPGNVEENPENVGEKPGNVEETPENSEENPENAEDRPENSEEEPENVEERPENSNEELVNPEEAENPEETAENPKEVEYLEEIFKRSSAEEEKLSSMQSVQDRNRAVPLYILCEDSFYDRESRQYDEKITDYLLVTRISKYFQVDEELLPDTCHVEELIVPGENGEPESGTEIKYPISQDFPDDQPFIIKIPIILKEEFRYTENADTLPVLCPIIKQEDEPEDEPKDDQEEQEQETYQGTYLAAVSDGKQEILARSEEMVTLNRTSTPADYTVSVNTDSHSPKAGQILTYDITLANTGKQPLPVITLESSINPSGISGRWYPEEETETDASGRKAIFTNLGVGETCQFHYQIKLPEELSGPVINTITAQAQKTTEPGNMLVRGASLKSEVAALKADFSVSKSANRTTAAPGDTITYQICIRNTGERTLHSVLSTERFQAENIKAQFLEKEGVILNSTKTQALISKIPPGEVFSLEAEVVLPKNLQSKELINQVLVRTKETGEKTIQSEAGVQILSISPTPVPAWGSEGNGENEVQNADAMAISDSPKTSDDANPMIWAEILGLSGLLLLGIWGYRKHWIKHEETLK